LAKVWITKGASEIEPLRSFYTQLRERQLPFATPLISEVLETQVGTAVSIEEALKGIPLKDLLDREPDNETLLEKGIIAAASVVEALNSVGDLPAARGLPILGASSLWTPNSSWGTVLSNLVTIRVNRYKDVVSRSVSNLEKKVTHIVSLLKSLSVTHMGIVHGDICTPNVLVDESSFVPTGLLDFGFLSTSADPLFDAVISTLIFDMYSSHAQEVRRRLHKIYSQKWGQQFAGVYPLYKAAYALATSNAYSEEGDDGHFRWCVDILNDEETGALVAQA
ncbi:MAG TPA: phosphotransferase, partial [Ktedonobacteraceae bacterium]|nr:phosphotransferase [Ktedonobacteraceae bacterium]